MSEHQIIAFRAIDGPVSDDNLEYMRQQSSRAEVTPWAFDNEYHYGDFRGDALEMLRRGYDLHLHYANFGIRKLLIRLPQGLPDPKAAQPFLGEEEVQFVKDKKGPGGALSISPFLEPGELDEIWDFDEILERLLPLRAEILDGDLRPLYLAHLAVAGDGNHDPEETTEAPVPAGLDKLTKAQQALAEFYGLSDALIAAAAQDSPPLAGPTDPRQQFTAWLRKQPAEIKDAWLASWLADPASAARREMLAEFREGHQGVAWPTVRLDRTIAALLASAEDIQRGNNTKAAEKTAREKANRLAAMATDPQSTLRETEKLVALRGHDAYRQIAELLAELREALAGTTQAGLAEQQARKLKDKNPTLSLLTSALRRQGFLPK